MTASFGVSWCFPPLDLLPLVLRFLDARRKAQQLYRIVVLVPETPKAPWFHLLQHYSRIAGFRVGSDLFRVRGTTGDWAKLPSSRVPYVVIKSGSV